MPSPGPRHRNRPRPPGAPPRRPPQPQPRPPPGGAFPAPRPRPQPSPRLALYRGPLPQHRVVVHPRPQRDHVTVVTAARVARLAGGDHRQAVVEAADVDDLAIAGRPGAKLVAVVGGVAGLPHGVGVAAP